jgi:hypothetical protein
MPLLRSLTRGQRQALAGMLQNVAQLPLMAEKKVRKKPFKAFTSPRKLKKFVARNGVI